MRPYLLGCLQLKKTLGLRSQRFATRPAPSISIQGLAPERNLRCQIKHQVSRAVCESPGGFHTAWHDQGEMPALPVRKCWGEECAGEPPLPQPLSGLRAGKPLSFQWRPTARSEKQSWPWQSWHFVRELPIWAKLQDKSRHEWVKNGHCGNVA